jgi:aryl-alcohol dehydrogenase
MRKKGSNGSDGSATIRLAGRPIFSNFFNQSSFSAYALANEANTVKVARDVPLETMC